MCCNDRALPSHRHHFCNSTYIWRFFWQDVDVSINYLWAALMFVFPMIGAVAYVHSSRLSIIVQIKMRAELTAAVYRKALALSSR